MSLSRLSPLLLLLSPLTDALNQPQTFKRTNSSIKKVPEEIEDKTPFVDAREETEGEEQKTSGNIKEAASDCPH